MMRVLMHNGEWNVVTVVCCHCGDVLEIEPQDCMTDEPLHKANKYHLMCPSCKKKTEYDKKTVPSEFWNGIVPMVDY